MLFETNKEMSQMLVSSSDVIPFFFFSFFSFSLWGVGFAGERGVLDLSRGPMTITEPE